MEYKTFETERLILRPTSENDAAFIFQLLNSPKFITYIGDRNVSSIEKAKEYIIDYMIPQLKRLSYSSYTLVSKADNQKIGTCGLYDREGLEGIDIGFAFLPEFEKKGFAFEASQKMLDAAFHEFGLKQVNAITTQDNISSQRLLEKLGLKFMSTTTLPNDTIKLLLFSIKKESHL